MEKKRRKKRSERKNFYFATSGNVSWNDGEIHPPISLKKPKISPLTKIDDENRLWM